MFYSCRQSQQLAPSVSVINFTVFVSFYTAEWMVWLRSIFTDRRNVWVWVSLTANQKCLSVFEFKQSLLISVSLWVKSSMSYIISFIFSNWHLAIWVKMGLLMLPLGNRVCSFLWTLASLCYGMTGLARWFLALEFAKTWLVILDLYYLAKVGLFGLFLLLDSTSALMSGTYSFLLKCCFQSCSRQSLPYLGNLPLTMSFFVMLFSERSLVLYATTFHIFPTLPTLGHMGNSGTLSP